MVRSPHENCDATGSGLDSMINLRPSFSNHSRGVDGPRTRESIVDLLKQLVIREPS
jgi:hypothetical protein